MLGDLWYIYFMTKALEKKIITTVQRAVADSIHNVLTDPDYGLELTPKVRARLSGYRRKKTYHLTSLADVRRRFA